LLDISSPFYFSNSTNPSSNLKGLNTGLRGIFLKMSSIGNGSGDVWNRSSGSSVSSGSAFFLLF